MKNPPAEQGIQDCWNHIGVFGNSSCEELLSYHHCRNCPVYLEAGRGLLDRKPPAGYLSEWTRLLAPEKAEPARGSISVVVFRVGSHWLAIPSHTLKEVSELSPIHSIPHRTNEILLGLVQIRGEIQLCIAIDKVLGLLASPEASRKSGGAFRGYIAAELSGHRWVWAADEVFGVYRFDPEVLRPGTAQLPVRPGGFFTWQGGDVMYLDQEVLLAALLRSLQ